MIRGITWNHTQSVQNHSGPSEVPYSANQYLVRNFFYCFLQQTGSRQCVCLCALFFCFLWGEFFNFEAFFPAIFLMFYTLFYTLFYTSSCLKDGWLRRVRMRKTIFFLYYFSTDVIFITQAQPNKGSFTKYVYKTRQVGGPKMSTFCKR